MGWVSNDRFAFRRAVTVRNSFVPIVTGRLVEIAGTAEMLMALRPGVPVVILAVGLVGVLTSAFTTRAMSALWAALAGLLFLATGGAVFLQEKRTTLQLLQDAFPGSSLCTDATRSRTT